MEQLQSVSGWSSSGSHVGDWQAASWLALGAGAKQDVNPVCSPTQGEAPARLYYFHLPKTGGVALNAALENSYEAADCHVHIAADDDHLFLQPANPLHRFISGHAGAAVAAAVAGTHFRLTMLRHPVERFFSYIMHGFRHQRAGVTLHAYRDVDHALGTLRDQVFQAYQNPYLLETLGKSMDQPWAVDLATLGEFDLVGLSHRQRRLLHLVSDRCGTFPISGDWRHNVSLNREALHELARRIEPHLHYFAHDIETFRLAENRFAQRYAAFVERLFDGVADPRLVTDDMVEERLLKRRFDAWRRRGKAADHIRIEMTGPQPGTGWWWRETNERVSYRWLGPELESTAYLPPVERRDYDLRIELVAIASGRIAAELAISIAGHRIEHRFEEVSQDPHDVKYVLHGIVREEMIPGDGEPLILTITCPEAIPALANNTMVYSPSTSGHDVRAVSLAIARLSLTPRTV